VPKEVAPQLFQGAMFNSGQVCCAIKRVFVHESQYDEVVDALAEEAVKAKGMMGDGMGKVMYGPINNKMQVCAQALFPLFLRWCSQRVVVEGKAVVRTSDE
jgi:acyl-CoA reductase-like NAD-dependent aldehyde dehydrogenase